MVGAQLIPIGGYLWAAYFGNRMSTIMRNRTGSANEPSVAMYTLSNNQMHFSTILEYKTAYYHNLQVGVFVKTVDHPNQWFNLSSPWPLASGVYGVYLK